MSLLLDLVHLTLLPQCSNAQSTQDEQGKQSDTGGEVPVMDGRGSKGIGCCERRGGISLDFSVSDGHGTGRVRNLTLKARRVSGMSGASVCLVCLCVCVPCAEPCLSLLALVCIVDVEVGR